MEEEKNIEEKELSNLSKAMSLRTIIILENLSRTHICKIYCNDGSHGTGFFCNIPFGWNNYLRVLMTNNHVLNKNDIQPGRVINFSLDNDYKEFNILIDNTRKTYTNELYDVSIIEIKKDDKIDVDSFFDLDRQIFQKNIREIFRNSEIYLLHYPKWKKMEISPGIIKYINKDKTTIYHTCDSSGGSSGGPIINQDNFQIIGIHKGAPERAKDYNFGTLLKEPLEQFNK